MAVEAGEDVPGLALAPVWGLVRSAESENPERFVLVDIDGDESSWGALAGALALGESQLAIRCGRVSVGRLRRVARVLSEGALEGVFDSSGTVLVTGGTGVLGGLVARHLVSEHGVGHLLLASRRGRDAVGAVELEEELVGLGAEVPIVACDVGDRDDLAVLLGKVSGEHPLRAWCIPRGDSMME